MSSERDADGRKALQRFDESVSASTGGRKQTIKYQYDWMFSQLVLFVRAGHNGSNKAYQHWKQCSADVQAITSIVNIDDESQISAKHKQTVVKGLPTLLINAKTALKKSVSKLTWEREEGAANIVKFLSTFEPRQQARVGSRGRSQIRVGRAVRTDGVVTEHGVKRSTVKNVALGSRRGRKVLEDRKKSSLPRTGALSESHVKSDSESRKASFDASIEYIRKNAHRIGADVDGSGGAFDPADHAPVPNRDVKKSADATRALFGSM
jgi:hypothetical protein